MPTTGILTKAAYALADAAGARLAPSGDRRRRLRDDDQDGHRDDDRACDHPTVAGENVAPRRLPARRQGPTRGPGGAEDKGCGDGGPREPAEGADEGRTATRSRHGH